MTLRAARLSESSSLTVTSALADPLTPLTLTLEIGKLECFLLLEVDYHTNKDRRTHLSGPFPLTLTLMNPILALPVTSY